MLALSGKMDNKHSRHEHSPVSALSCLAWTGRGERVDHKTVLLHSKKLEYLYIFFKIKLILQKVYFQRKHAAPSLKGPRGHEFDPAESDVYGPVEYF